jgi:hypothetical protein
MKFKPEDYAGLAAIYSAKADETPRLARSVQHERALIASALRIASRATEEGIVNAVRQSVMHDGRALDGPIARAILKHLGEE